MVISNIKNKLIDNPVIGAKPYLLIKVLYYLYMITTVFSGEVFVGQAWNDKFNWFDFDIIGSYFLIFSINLLLGLFILFLGQYYFKCKINKPILVVELICLIGIIVASFSFPAKFQYIDSYYQAQFGKNAVFTYYLNIEDRIHYFLTTLLLLLFFYNTFVIIPATYKYKRSQFGFYYFIIGLCFIAIIYSLFADFNIYKEIFTLDLKLWNSYGLKSFLGTKNVFGSLLLFGMISSLLLENYTKKIVYLFVAIFLYIEIIFSMCKVSVVAGLFLIITYMIYTLLTNLKDKFRRSLYISLIGSSIIILTILLLLNNNPLSYLLKRNFSEILNRVADEDSGTFFNRRLIQERIFVFLLNNPSFFIFGVGNYQFYHVAFFAADDITVNIWHPHNGVFMALGEGGIIRLLAYILLHVYLLEILINKIFKGKNKDAILYLLILITYEIRTITEPDYFLSSTWVSVIFTFLIVVPIISLNIKEENETTFTLKNKNVNYMYYLSLLASSIIGIGFVSNKIWFNVPLITLGVILLSYSIYFNPDKKNLVNNTIYNFGLTSALLLTGFVIKINNHANLATTIEFGFYSFVVSLFSFYFVTHFNYLKLSFVSLTNIENKFDKKNLKIKGNLINE